MPTNDEFQEACRVGTAIGKMELELSRLRAERDLLTEQVISLKADCRMLNQAHDEMAAENRVMRDALTDLLALVVSIDEQVGPERMKQFRVDPYGTIGDAQDALSGGETTREIARVKALEAVVEIGKSVRHEHEPDILDCLFCKALDAVGKGAVK